MSVYTCEICGETFKSSQALGSHQRYRHPRNEKDNDVLDMKEEFRRILKDVGVRKALNVIANTYFDMGADDLKNLEYILNKAGVTNPSRSMIMMRWSQRIGEEIPKESLKDEAKRASDVFEAFDRLAELEMRDLLLEKLRARTEKKNGEKTKRIDESEGLKDKMAEILSELRLQRRAQRERQRPPYRRNGAWPCDDLNHSPSCVVCGTCGFHGYIDKIRPNGVFVCPECDAEYVNTPY